MVQFVKQSDKVKYPNRCFSANLSTEYLDVFDNKATTATVKARPQMEGLFLEIPTAQTPDYGSGDVVGYKLGLYLNNLNKKGNPQISIWKAKTGITKNEGNFGTNIVKDIHAITAFHSEQPAPVFTESFATINNPGTIATVTTDYVYYASEPFIDYVDAFTDANYLGKNGTYDDDGWVRPGREEFRSEYVTSLPNGREVVKVVSVMDPLEGRWYGEGSPSMGERGHRVKQAVAEFFTGGNGTGAQTLVSAVQNPEYKWKPKDGTGWFDATDDPYWPGDYGKVREEFREAIAKNTEITNSRKSITDLSKDTVFHEAHSTHTTYFRDLHKETRELKYENGLFYTQDDVMAGATALELGASVDVPLINNTSTFVDNIDGLLQPQLQFNTVVMKDIPGPIRMHKGPQKSNADVVSTAAENKVQSKILLTMKIKRMSNIMVLDKTTDKGVFPSRGFAVWFKDKEITKGAIHLGDDIKKNHYKGNNTNMESVSTTAADIGAHFCGFILYKFDGEFYIRSIGKAGSAGFNGTVGMEGGALGPKGLNPPVMYFDNPGTTSTNTVVKFDKDPTNQWIQLMMTFNPRTSGFKLDVVNVDDQQTMCEHIDCPGTDASGTFNETNSWPIMSISNCNTPSKQTVSDHLDLRIEVAAESVTNANDEGTGGEGNDVNTFCDVCIDNVFMTKAGMNYKHMNNTRSIGNTITGDRMGISNRIVLDSSADIASNAEGQDIETTTGFAPATFMALGFENLTDIAPQTNSEPKHIFFSNHSLDGSQDDNGEINPDYVRWAFTTNEAKLGHQAYGTDNDGNNDPAGTLGQATQVKVEGGSGVNRIYHTTQGENSFSTNLLSNHFWTQKGHIALVSSDVTDATSMNLAGEKRECIFASSRIVKSNKVPYIYVDTVKPLYNLATEDAKTEYMIYNFDQRYAPTNYKTGLRVVEVNLASNKLTVGNYNKKSDAHVALAANPLTYEGGSFSTNATTNRLEFTTAGYIKLGAGGTVVNPLDYFNVGDTITITVSGSVKTIEGNHTVTEVAADYIGVTNVSGSETIGSATLGITKTGNDILITDTTDDRYAMGRKAFLCARKYWLFAEIFNYDANGDRLADKSFSGVVVTDFKTDATSHTGSNEFAQSDFGVTWNEFEISDTTGYDNSWTLQRNAAHRSAFVTDFDFGYGAFDTEAANPSDPDTPAISNYDNGGYVEKFIPKLTVSGEPQFNIIDISNLSKYKQYDAEESLYLFIQNLDTDGQSSANFSTFHHETEVFDMHIDSSTTAAHNDSNGEIILAGGNVIDSNVTHVVINDKDENGNDLTNHDIYGNYLSHYLKKGAKLKIKKTGSSNSLEYTMSDDATDNTTYWSCPVTASTVTKTGSSGSNFSNFFTDEDKVTLSINSGTSKRPFLLTIFEDELPAHPVLTVTPYENDPFLAHYKWEASEDDLWYGLLLIDNEQIQNQYHRYLYHIPLNEVLTGYDKSDYTNLILIDSIRDPTDDTATPINVAGIEDRYDGLAGHTKMFNADLNTGLSFATAQVSTGEARGNGNRFSILCHVTPDTSTLTGDHYILYQKGSVNNDVDYCWTIYLNSSGNIVASMQGRTVGAANPTNVATTLTSSSVIPRDNETPTSICLTLDNEIEAQNVKLYINGVLEASTGLLRAAANTNTTTQWAKDCIIEGGGTSHTGLDKLYIGCNSDAGANGFNGKIEEIVAYEDVIYPVNPKDGEYIFTKNNKEFEPGALPTPLSYVARLFVKDYHNIRGTSTSDVATSAPVSFRKPILGIRGD
jgi:hypothetical protein